IVRPVERRDGWLRGKLLGARPGGGFWPRPRQNPGKKPVLRTFLLLKWNRPRVCSTTGGTTTVVTAENMDDPSTPLSGLAPPLYRVARFARDCVVFSSNHR